MAKHTLHGPTRLSILVLVLFPAVSFQQDPSSSAPLPVAATAAAAPRLVRSEKVPLSQAAHGDRVAGTDPPPGASAGAWLAPEQEPPPRAVAPREPAAATAFAASVPSPPVAATSGGSAVATSPLGHDDSEPDHAAEAQQVEEKKTEAEAAAPGAEGQGEPEGAQEIQEPGVDSVTEDPSATDPTPARKADAEPLDESIPSGALELEEAFVHAVPGDGPSFGSTGSLGLVEQESYASGAAGAHSANNGKFPGYGYFYGQGAAGMLVEDVKDLEECVLSINATEGAVERKTLPGTCGFDGQQIAVTFSNYEWNLRGLCLCITRDPAMCFLQKGGWTCAHPCNLEHAVSDFDIFTPYIDDTAAQIVYKLRSEGTCDTYGFQTPSNLDAGIALYTSWGFGWSKDYSGGSSRRRAGDVSGGDLYGK